jgi:pimeloyl-ACP methyl ester carboxylesterase
LKNNLKYPDFPSCWITIAGLNIHYKCLGKGPPVVLIHGGGNDWHEWKSNLSAIGQRFQVLALDLPGFGLSQSPSTAVSPSWTIEFLKIFLECLGITRPHLIGHSMGGMISIAFAACYPESVNKLVLIDPSGLGKISFHGRLLLSIFRTIDRWQGKRRGPQYLIGSFIEECQVKDKLPKIKSPTLVVWGQNDIYLPVSQSRIAHTLIPGSQLNIFPQCGHAPQRENFAKFNNLVIQFLANES